MRILTTNEIDSVSGGIARSDVLFAGAGITGAGGLIFGAAALLAPEFAIPAAIYGFASGGFTLAGIASEFNLF